MRKISRAVYEICTSLVEFGQFSSRIWGVLSLRMNFGSKFSNCTKKRILALNLRKISRAVYEISTSLVQFGQFSSGIWGVLSLRMNFGIKFLNCTKKRILALNLRKISRAVYGISTSLVKFGQFSSRIWGVLSLRMNFGIKFSNCTKKRILA